MPNVDGHIRVLPIHVANKIAAGEVVERPASVVKELVENSIDAGAKSIKISVLQGGRKYISVQDDGSGMTREDALLCLERQATSKIHDVGDIEEIDTLGFRGEAIPSIAAVSRFSLTTRRHDADEATKIDVDAGTLANVASAGAPPGTLVEVRDLFCNVPARRKFLRAVVTEEGHIKNFFTSIALSHCAISFSLSFDGREMYRLAASESFGERVRELLGDAFMDSALEVNYEGDEVSVAGFIERPNLGNPTRKEQYIFINGRAATAAPVAYALREAYPRRQGDTRPAVVLFISLPPKSIDVNVHPAKREVRFRNGAAVKAALVEALGQAIGTRSQEKREEGTGKGEEVKENRQEDCAIQPPNPSTFQPAKPPPPPPPQSNNRKIEESQIKKVPVAANLPIAAPSGEKAKPWTWYKFLAFTESGYLLLETDSGIVTLNPRAARERISYEHLMDHAEAPVSQMLLIPETIQLSPAEYHRIEAALPAIRAMGIGIEPFGRDTFKIESVPLILRDASVRDIIETIAADLAASGPSRSSRWREELIAKSIARSYSGAKIVLDETSAVRLVEELVACRMPYLCPRGKSVMIFTSTRELERKFS